MLFLANDDMLSHVQQRSKTVQNSIQRQGGALIVERARVIRARMMIERDLGVPVSKKDAFLSLCRQHEKRYLARNNDPAAASMSESESDEAQRQQDRDDDKPPWEKWDEGFDQFMKFLLGA